MGEYWDYRWKAMSDRFTPEKLKSFRSNDLGQWVVRQRYRNGEAEGIVRDCIDTLGEDRCEDSLVGNPKPMLVFQVGSRYVTPESCVYAYSAARINIYVQTRINAAEVGAGYGGLAYALSPLSRLKPMAYTFIDHPESLRIQSYFHGQRQDAPRDMTFTSCLAQDYDYSPHNLIVSMRCLSEMPRDEAVAILARIKETAKAGAVLYLVAFTHMSARNKSEVFLPDRDIDLDGWEIIHQATWPFDSLPAAEIVLRRL